MVVEVNPVDYEPYIGTITVSDLLEAHRAATHAHGWSDNSFAHDLGEELAYLLGDTAYDNDGEPLFDYEDLGDAALARIAEVAPGLVAA
jgi:hypothetical protein